MIIDKILPLRLVWDLDWLHFIVILLFHLVHQNESSETKVIFTQILHAFLACLGSLHNNVLECTTSGRYRHVVLRINRSQVSQSTLLGR